MDDLTTWAALVGTLAPLVIAIVQRPGWSDAQRTLVSVIFCLVAGVGTAYLEGSLTSVDVTARGVFHAALAVVFSAQVAYRSFWKPAGVSGAIESATSPTTTPTTEGGQPEESSV
jgi:hypothetical protein